MLLLPSTKEGLILIVRTIPRDISKYDAAQIGPLTTRQFIGLVLGAVVAIPSYFLFRSALGESALLLSTVLALPFLLCGFYKPYDIPFERYARSVFASVLLSPTKKKYGSENTYHAIFFDETDTTNNKKTKKKRKTKSRRALD